MFLPFLCRSLPAADASSAARWDAVLQNGRAPVPTPAAAAAADGRRSASATTVPAESHVHAAAAAATRPTARHGPWWPLRPGALRSASAAARSDASQQWQQSHAALQSGSQSKLAAAHGTTHTLSGISLE